MRTYLVTDRTYGPLGTAVARDAETAIATVVARRNRPSRHFPMGGTWRESECEATVTAAPVATPFKVSCIEALRDAEGTWQWDTLTKAGTADIHAPVNTRSILRALRESGHLASSSAGALTVERDCSGPDDSYEIQERTTGRPLFLIEPLDNLN